MAIATKKSTQKTLTKVLQEQTYSGEDPSVDEESGVIRNVKVLGTISRNGREYSPNALKDACRILEGCSVNLDHNRDNPNRERSFMESVGTLHGLYVKPDGVYAAELRIKKTHPTAPVIFESAKRFPKNFGLSINAEGEMVKRGGKWIVESIKRAQSVDVVSNPATTEGIFESVDTTRKAKTVKVTVKKLVEAHGTPEMKTRLQKLCEGGQSGLMDQPVDVQSADDDTPFPAPGDGDCDADDMMAQDPLDAVNDAFIALVASVMQNAALALADKVKQITAILTTQDELMNGDAAGKTDETPVQEDDQMADDSAADEMQESVKAVLSELKTLLLESNQKHEQRQDEIEARQLLVESQIKVLPERVKALAAEKDQSKRAALLESWPTERPVVLKPMRSAPAHEPSDDKFPTDHRGFMAKLKS